jgi:MFS family permease
LPLGLGAIFVFYGFQTFSCNQFYFCHFIDRCYRHWTYNTCGAGLIEQLIHGNISDASRYSGWLAFAYASMQFLFSPLLGNLSDRYGRRPVLLFSLLGLGIDYIFLALAPSIGWLFLGRIIAGPGGSKFFHSYCVYS